MMEPVDPFIQDSLRKLPRHVPRATFREEMRQAFLADAGAVTGDAPATLPSPARSRSGVWIPVVAAAALLALAVWGARPAAVWTAQPAAGLYVDGEPLTAEGLLPPGALVENRGTTPARLTIPGDLVCELSPGTVAQFEGRRHLAAGPYRFTVQDGMVLGATDEGFPGHRLEVAPREGLTTITGTTFGVLTGADSTCVCVLEGSVRLLARGLEARMVDPGASWIVYRDGRERGEPLREDQIAMLRAVRDTTGAP